MKAIYKVLGFLIYWLIGKKEEGEGNVEIVLGLDWLWIGIYFEGWRWGKFRLNLKAIWRL